MLRLTVHDSQSGDQLDDLLFEGGRKVIGRESGDGRWKIDVKGVSRTHCEIFNRGAFVFVRDLNSTNGTFCGEQLRKLTVDEEHKLADGESFALGKQILVRVHSLGSAPPPDPEVEAVSGSIAQILRTWWGKDFERDVLDAPAEPPSDANDDGWRHFVERQRATMAKAVEVPSEWPSGPDDSASGPNWTAGSANSALASAASGLEAFLQGANIDLALAEGESADEVLRRAGAAYRQAILLCADLLKARTVLRDYYQIDDTEFGDDNPIKYESPDKAAKVLLCPRGETSLSPADALASVGRDIKRHDLGIFAGLRAALSAIADQLDPDFNAGAQFGSVFGPRALQRLDALKKRREVVKREIEGKGRGPIFDSYRQAYKKVAQTPGAPARGAKLEGAA